MGTAGIGNAPDLREHLLEAVLPFWERFSVDRDYGGFITHLARDGAITDSSEKFLVMQARMIYSFAAGAELGGPAEWLSLADQGAEFLMQHFRDRVHDGWFWSTSRQGQPMQTAKRTYGHAFVTYALAEYSRVAHNNRALASATHTWSLISDHLWDTQGGGAIEACDREWKPTERGHTMGTHLHLLEALLALNAAAGGNRYWSQIRSLADLVVARMVAPDHKCGLERFSRDWLCTSEDAVNYGHNLEAAWLLLRVHQIENEPTYRDTARQFLDYVVEFGLDSTHGGVFSHGPLGHPATIRERIWWVQSEALVAFLLGYLVFRDSRYWEAFLNTADFCLRRLHDPEHGEWFASTAEDGTPRQIDKGSEWKAAYHVTQACCYGHEYLQQIAEVA
jgi:mannobiose 2-epimerase